jgi:hypothetical protein
MPACMIHENAPHHLRRDTEKLRPILPGDAVLIDQPQVRFVNECGRLQGMFGRSRRRYAAARRLSSR